VCDMGEPGTTRCIALVPRKRMSGEVACLIAWDDCVVTDVMNTRALDGVALSASGSLEAMVLDGW
jgi:hypothetical protein